MGLGPGRSRYCPQYRRRYPQGRTVTSAVSRRPVTLAAWSAIGLSLDRLSYVTSAVSRRVPQPGQTELRSTGWQMVRIPAVRAGRLFPPGLAYGKFAFREGRFLTVAAL
ncbi:MAG TPA: hypothetical protein PLQ00_16480 [Thermoguttaceae bacterium]|nr:hypothetical protein [Thermoguttaceae bacterium]